MSANPERPIGPGFRALLAIIGLTALLAALIVANAEVRLAMGGPPLLHTLVVAFCAVVVAGGALLVRGALRGRIRFRRVRRRGSSSAS